MFFKNNALNLHNKGYNIIPILPNTKRPSIRAWQTVKPNIINIKHWIRNRPNHGIGILTADTPCIDVDVTEEDLANEILLYILSLIPNKNIVIRTGNPPKFLIPFCLENTTTLPFNKQRMVLKSKSDDNQMIEILGTGQMAVFIAEHPKTGKAYIIDNELPEHHKLPILTHNIINKIREKFEDKDLTNLLNTNSLNKSRANPITQISDNEIINILDDIHKQYNSPNHDQWLTVGMALHYQYQGNKKGETLWHYFSQKNVRSYEPKEITDRYNSFNCESNSNGFTLGTLKFMTYTYQQRIKPEKFIINKSN